MPPTYLLKIKKTLDLLKNVITTNLVETYFKVENKLAKHFFDMILTFYKPIKPIYLI